MAGLKAIKGSITRDSYETALNSLTNLNTLGGVINYSSTSHGGITHMFLVRAAGGQRVPVAS